jgi:Leucine-rich repeat (LRR) protein
MKRTLSPHRTASLIALILLALSALTSLQTFLVNNNQLTGIISVLTGLTNLQSFYVNNNQLTGTIQELADAESCRRCRVRGYLGSCS